MKKKLEDKNPMVRTIAKEALKRISLPLPDGYKTLLIELEIEVGERPEPESPQVTAEIIETPEAPQVEINREAFNFFEPVQIERSN